MKRSSCASGRAKVPSYSIGFWVAMTRNGDGIGYVTPSIVAWCSSMHSSSALCVFGVARLISSASTTWAMIGPGRNSNSAVFWLKIERPVTSDGSRSGVNWMRRKLQPILRLIALASIVLPTPGTSSIRMWPSHRRATRAIRTSRCLPMITRSTLAATRSAESWTLFNVSIPVLGGPIWAPSRPQYPSRGEGGSSGACACARSAAPQQAQPLGHHPPANRGRGARAGATPLDDDRHRDVRLRSVLPWGKADEPGVGGHLGAALGSPGLAGGQRAVNAVSRDRTRPGVHLADQPVHRVDHRRAQLAGRRGGDCAVPAPATVRLHHRFGWPRRRICRVSAEVAHHECVGTNPSVGDAGGGRTNRRGVTSPPARTD